MKKGKTLLPIDLPQNRLTTEQYALLLRTCAFREVMDESEYTRTWFGAGELVDFLAMQTIIEAELKPESLDYCGENFQTRFTPPQIVERVFSLAHVVVSSVNNRFLTEEEWFLGGLRATHLAGFARQMATDFGVRAPAPTAPKIISPGHLYKEALKENRDLWDKLESARRQTQLAQEKFDRVQTENRRLRARDRELVAQYKAMHYGDYLKTPHWQETRAAAIARAKGKCQGQGCAATQDLQVHHESYDRVGEEIPADLTVLCRPCHAKRHDKPE